MVQRFRLGASGIRKRIRFGNCEQSYPKIKSPLLLIKRKSPGGVKRYVSSVSYLKINKRRGSKDVL